jgi:pSer/pThr/pTyr-binding forkhead associated (FHA) protein
MTNQKTGSVKCKDCGYMNRVGVIFCDNCGVQVSTGLPPQGIHTRGASEDLMKLVRQLGDERARETLEVDQENDPSIYSTGSSLFSTNMALEIYLLDAQDRIKVRPFEGVEMIFGRVDPDSHHYPDIDLMPYGGYRLGISRKHAAINRDQTRLLIRDLGSSNGTQVNGVRLAPMQYHTLHDKDKILMGSLGLQIHFVPGMEA